MTSKISVILISLVLICTLLTGCIFDSRRSDIGAQKDFVPEEGGVLNLSTYSPDTLNPLSTQYSCVRDFLYLAYEGLFTVNEDLSVNPVIADSYKSYEKNTLFVIKLKKNIRFHDGSHLTSKDVAASFDYVRNYSSRYAHALSNVAYYDTDGDYSIKIGLKSPQFNFVCNLDFPILPSGLGAGDFATPNTGYKINGTGRYKYSHTEPYTAVVLKKNPSWHGSTPVYIPEVNVRFVNSNEAILHAFDSGETDMVTTERGRWGEFSFDSSLKTSEVTTTRYMYIGMNTQSSAFSDIELRKSLASLIDKQDIIDSLMFSHACIADTPITTKSTFSQSNEKKEYQYTDDYIKSKKGLKVYILYNEESSTKAAIARHVKSRLEEAGVRAELTCVDYSAYRDRINSGDYELYIGEINMSRDCDLTFMFKTAQLPSVPAGDDVVVKLDSALNSPRNISGICDFASSKLDDIISNINFARDEEELVMAYNNLRTFYDENLPQIPLFHINDALIVNGRIKGKLNANITNLYSDIGNIYIK